MISTTVDCRVWLTGIHLLPSPNNAHGRVLNKNLPMFSLEMRVSGKAVRSLLHCKAVHNENKGCVDSRPNGSVHALGGTEEFLPATLDNTGRTEAGGRNGRVYKSLSISEPV